jgi:hypothetical protein
MLKSPSSFVSWISGIQHALVGARRWWVLSKSCSSTEFEIGFRFYLLITPPGNLMIYFRWSTSLLLPHYPEYNPVCQWYFFTGVFLLAPAHIISCLHNKANYTKMSIYSCNLRRLCVCLGTRLMFVLYLCILIQVYWVPLHLCLIFHLSSYLHRQDRTQRPGWVKEEQTVTLSISPR